MTFPAELRSEIARVLADERSIFMKGRNNPIMKALDKTLKAVSGIHKDIDIHAIDFSYAILSDTEAELAIITPVESMYNPMWVANRMKKEFQKADPRINFELVKEEEKAAES